jgi:hypothetical protein
LTIGGKRFEKTVEVEVGRAMARSYEITFMLDLNTYKHSKSEIPRSLSSMSSPPRRSADEELQE